MHFIVEKCNFTVNGKYGLMFTIGKKTFKQYLPFNTKVELLTLLKAINLYYDDCKNMSHEELFIYLWDKIEFNIPPELNKYKRGSIAIYDKFQDFNQIYIPLSKQNEDGSIFKYKVKKYGQSIEKYQWYKYPFTIKSDKHDMQVLCKSIGLMDIKESDNYTKEEIADILNEKFILAENCN